MKPVHLAVIALIATVVLAGCAPGPNTAMDTPGPDGTVAGFLLGLWHGIIAPITFILSLFWDEMNVYEIHNNGGWYDFGFVLGAGILFGGGRSAARRRGR